MSVTSSEQLKGFFLTLVRQSFGQLGVSDQPITDYIATVLTDFSLSQGKLGLGGLSSAASRLIPTLAGDPLIRNPAFVAPATRAEERRSGDATRLDRFAIRAELAP